MRAASHSMACDICTLWCRFVLSHPLLASVIVGAMDAEQLTELLDIAEGSRLPEDVAEAADAIHQQFPNPCP